MTPLSVHSRGGGHTNRRPAASAIAVSRPRMYWLLATPPATTRCRTCGRVGYRRNGDVRQSRQAGKPLRGANQLASLPWQTLLCHGRPFFATTAGPCPSHTPPYAHLRVRLRHPAHRPAAALLQVCHSHALEAGRNVGAQLAVGLCGRAPGTETGGWVAGTSATAGRALARLFVQRQADCSAGLIATLHMTFVPPTRQQHQTVVTHTAQTPLLTCGLGRLVLYCQPHRSLQPRIAEVASRPPLQGRRRVCSSQVSAARPELPLLQEQLCSLCKCNRYQAAAQAPSRPHSSTAHPQHCQQTKTVQPHLHGYREGQGAGVALPGKRLQRSAARGFQVQTQQPGHLVVRLT